MMKISYNLKYHLYKGMFLFGSLMVSCYFILHALTGNYSLKAYEDLQIQEEALLVMAQDLNWQKQQMQNKVERLGGQRIDPDLLEEEVRRQLGFAHPDEIIILVK